MTSGTKFDVCMHVGVTIELPLVVMDNCIVLTSLTDTRDVLLRTVPHDSQHEHDGSRRNCCDDVSVTAS